MPHNILGLASVGPIVEAGNERLSVLGSLGVTGQSARVRTSAGSPEKPHAECGRPHLMREIGTDSSMSGDGKRGDAAWPKLPRPSSTLPTRTGQDVRDSVAVGGKQTFNGTCRIVAGS